MKPSRALLLFLFAVPPGVEVAAQVERPIPYPIPQSGAWRGAVGRGTRAADGAPGPRYWSNVAHYDMQAELDPATAIVTGHVDMTYHNRSPDALRTLVVHLRQNLHRAGVQRNVQAEITGGVEVSNVFVDAMDPGSRGVSIRGTVMTIRLPERLAPNASTTVSLDWKVRVPKAGAPRNGHENFHVYYLGYWYPQFAVYDDVQGWVAEPYMGNAEFYMGYADYDLAFTAPQGWLVRATGSLENANDVLTEAARERLERARTSRDIVNVITADELRDGKVTQSSTTGKLTWRFKARDVRDVAVSVSDRYVWDATHAVIPDRDGPGRDGVAMIHAVYETNARAFERAADFARQTIEHMSKTVYPYPWPHMTACEGVIGGGMEFPMMTICGSRGRSVQGVITHELIHMWFPMLVGTNEKARAWQDEGITSFFTPLVTAAHPDARPSRRRQSFGGYLGMAARGELAPLMTHGDRYPPGGYGFSSYAKPAAVFGQLRDMLGEETFFTAMRKYAADWAYKHPYPEDLFHTFNTVAGQNLDWYFRIWFYETWTLDQAIESVRAIEGGTKVVIADLSDATYPTEIEVTYEGGKTEAHRVDVRYWLSGKRKKTLELGPNVTKIVLDPRGVTLDTSRRNNVWEKQKGGK